MRAKAVDVCWGSFVTAVWSTLVLLIANWIGPKILGLRHAGQKREARLRAR
jgi:hypothetical protein